MMIAAAHLTGSRQTRKLARDYSPTRPDAVLPSPTAPRAPWHSGAPSVTVDGHVVERVERDCRNIHAQTFIQFDHRPGDYNEYDDDSRVLRVPNGRLFEVRS